MAVGVVVGVAAQANAISTKMDSRTCRMGGSDMEDRKRTESRLCYRTNDEYNQ